MGQAGLVAAGSPFARSSSINQGSSASLVHEFPFQTKCLMWPTPPEITSEQKRFNWEHNSGTASPGVVPASSSCGAWTSQLLAGTTDNLPWEGTQPLPKPSDTCEGRPSLPGLPLAQSCPYKLLLCHSSSTNHQIWLLSVVSAKLG